MRRFWAAAAAGLLVLTGCASTGAQTVAGIAQQHGDKRPARLAGPVGEPGALPCYAGDANRVQGIYAVAAGKTDRYAQVVGSLKQYAASVDAIFNNSAAQSGGVRHIRWVQDGNCEPIIDHVVIPAGSDGSFGSIRDALKAQGYTRTDRHYLVWSDGGSVGGFCGTANILGDSQPGQANANNTSAFMGVVVCWGGMVEAHELAHTLGAVQLDAPHTTGQWHCTDEPDRMCEQGASVTVCNSSNGGESILDCNHDDYFRAAPPPAGSYLASHWNVADSPYLEGSDGTQPTPSPSPTTTSPSPTSTVTPTVTPTSKPCGKSHRPGCR